MVRLGRKYEIAHFTAMALEYLRQLFLRTLYGWDDSRNAAENVFRHDKRFLIDVINIGYECQIPSILPGAFLHLCRWYTLVGFRWFALTV